jgi:type I restriction enzyme S subunit
VIKATLEDVCSIQSGGTPSRGTESYWGGSIPWAKISDLEASGEGYISDTEEHISEEGLAAIRGRIFGDGTLLFAMYGSVGKAAIVRGLVSTNQAILGIYPDASRLDLNYLKFWLRSQQHKFDQDAQGVAQKNLSAGYVRSLEIPLPPLPEQKRIAAILDKADAIRRKRQQAVKLADDFIRAVFLDMFGDPVTNPKGFRKGPITELVDIITGNAFKSDEYVKDSEKAVRLCRGTNVLTSYFDWSDTAYWPKDQLDGLERYLLSSGDVILAMDRPWISSGLKVCIFSEQEVDTYLVQRVARLRPKETMFSEYIYSCIKSKAFEKHCCPTETTVPHISPVELRGYEVLIPDKTTLSSYHVAVDKVKSAITRMQTAVSHTGNAFDSLSQKAFSGQL